MPNSWAGIGHRPARLVMYILPILCVSFVKTKVHHFTQWYLLSFQVGRIHCGSVEIRFIISNHKLSISPNRQYVTPAVPDCPVGVTLVTVAVDTNHGTAHRLYVLKHEIGLGGRLTNTQRHRRTSHVARRMSPVACRTRRTYIYSGDVFARAEKRKLFILHIPRVVISLLWWLVWRVAEQLARGIEILRSFTSHSRIMTDWSHVIRVCYQTCLKNLFASC